MIDRGTDYATDWETASPTWKITPRQTATEDLRAEIAILAGGRLKAVEKQIHDATRSRYAEVDRLSRQAAALGGKRLRPTLALLSAQAALPSGAASQRRLADLRAISTAVELVHAASLVHDDVMDHADERRHRPTVGAIAGNSSAVLLGDFLFTKAYGVAATCRNGYPARQIAKAATALCEGELRQQASAGNWNLSLPHYRSILGQKTGSLCAVSGRLGAWAVGGSKEAAQALAKFGYHLGVAFQIFDDWLDYWGSEEVGKTLGTDLQQRKPTLPLLRLLEVVDDRERAELIELLTRSAGPDEMTRIRELLDHSDACEYTLAEARNCVGRAIGSLDALADSASKACLTRIAAFSVSRAA